VVSLQPQSGTATEGGWKREDFPQKVTLLEAEHLTGTWRPGCLQNKTVTGSFEQFESERQVKQWILMNCY
jgi:hypothetical protein